MTISDKTKEITSQAEPYFHICFKYADEIRNLLNVDENGFKLIIGSGHYHTRDYYVYGILDEIEKAGVAILQLQEFLSDSNQNAGETRLSRNILSSTLDEASLWIRKLTELLIEIKCFLDTNKNEYFKHYLLIKRLEAYRKLNTDYKDFFNCENRNIAHSIQIFEKEISSLESKLDIKKCWYLKSRKLNNKREFSDVRFRLKSILKKCNDLEKAALGFSYEDCFTRPSRSIHPNIGGPDYKLTISDIKTAQGHIGLLSAIILIECKRLLGSRSRKLLREVELAIKNNEATNKIKINTTKPNISLGDLVVAYGDLAQVTGIVKSDFGYRSFKVKYLSRPPIPEIPNDMFTAKYVNLVVKRKKITRQVKTELERINPNEKLSNRRISSELKKSVIYFWDNLGLKEYVHGRPDVMIKKIETLLKDGKITS